MQGLIPLTPERGRQWLEPRIYILIVDLPGFMYRRPTLRSSVESQLFSFYMSSPLTPIKDVDTRRTSASSTGSMVDQMDQLYDEIIQDLPVQLVSELFRHQMQRSL